MRDELINSLNSFLSKYKVDFADLRHLRRVTFEIVVQDGRIYGVSSAEIYGVGARVLLNGAWGFSAINSPSKNDIMNVLEEAYHMARSYQDFVTEKSYVANVKPIEDTTSLPVKINPLDVPIDEKIKKVVEIEREMRKYDNRIKNTIVSYREVIDEETIANSFGTNVKQKIIRTIVSVFVTAYEKGTIQRAYERAGGTRGYELFEEFVKNERYIKACERAIKLLSAKEPPSGKYPVILSPSVVGLLVHEAFGHNCEADHVLSGESILENKLGKRVASELVTIVDNSNVPGAFGSYKYDSEGVPGRRRVIVEKGILKGFLHSLETAAKLNAEPNGSARAYTHLHKPIVRMSNTYIEPGDWSLEEMIEDLKIGVYCKESSWGYVFTERGQFTCNVDEAYLIEKGEITQMLRNLSFGGLTLETLLKVDAVGKDFRLADPGMCGKSGQAMFVDGGGPHIRIKEVVIGGRV